MSYMYITTPPPPPPGGGGGVGVLPYVAYMLDRVCFLPLP